MNTDEQGTQDSEIDVKKLVDQAWRPPREGQVGTSCVKALTWSMLHGRKSMKR